VQKKTKILFSVNGFPAKSETFIVNHIVTAINSGMDISILANHKQSLNESTQKDLLIKHQLLDKVILKENIPKNKFKTFIKVFKLILKKPKSLKYFFSLLNPLRYGFTNINQSAFFELYAILDLTNFDIYHAHFGQNAIGIATAKDLGLIKSKLITTFHGYDASFENEKAKNRLINSYKNVFKHSNVITANTPYLQEIIRNLGFSKSIVLPMSVNTDFFKPNANISLKKTTTINLITIGRLVKFKCHYIGIEAVKILVNKGHDIKYLIVGNGPEYSNLKQQIESLKLSNHIFLLKNKTQKEIKNLFLESDIFLMTSNYDDYGRRETQGVVTIEAQASGLPVIAFASGGVPYTIIKNKTGFLADEMDIKNYIKKLEDLISDKKLREIFGVNARNFVLENYSNIVCEKKLLEIYHN